MEIYPEKVRNVMRLSIPFNCKLPLLEDAEKAIYALWGELRRQEYSYPLLFAMSKVTPNMQKKWTEATLFIEACPITETLEEYENFPGFFENVEKKCQNESKNLPGTLLSVMGLLSMLILSKRHLRQPAWHYWKHAWKLKWELFLLKVTLQKYFG